MHNRRLALGTVQFGMRYGVANRVGQIGGAEARRIMETAHGAGMDTLDTAAAYGDAEAVLGSIGVADWNIVSKIPRLPSGCADVHAWVRTSATGMLARLGVKRLGGLLLHEPMQLLGPSGEALYAALRQLREEGLTERIGISVYGPEQLEALIGRYEFDLVQAPFNVLDRRLAASGWLARLRDAGVAIHARSLFLQGLLLMEPARRPPGFARWQSLWDHWHSWLEDSGLTAIQACVGFVTAYREIDRAVVGVDSLRQLEEILSAPPLGGVEAPPTLACEERDLVDPSRWHHLRGAA